MTAASTPSLHPQQKPFRLVVWFSFRDDVPLIAMPMPRQALSLGRESIYACATCPPALIHLHFPCSSCFHFPCDLVPPSGITGCALGTPAGTRRRRAPQVWAGWRNMRHEVANKLATGPRSIRPKRAVDLPPGSAALRDCTIFSMSAITVLFNYAGPIPST